jgi:predicted transcriptional regulator
VHQRNWLRCVNELGLQRKSFGSRIKERDDMKRSTIQNLASLEREMRAVARGERAAPVDAAEPSFNSAEALRRLLTPADRQMLARIGGRKPGSVPKK